jgi:hypothetical protein
MNQNIQNYTPNTSFLKGQPSENGSQVVLIVLLHIFAAGYSFEIATLPHKFQQRLTGEKIVPINRSLLNFEHVIFWFF